MARSVIPRRAARRALLLALLLALPGLAAPLRAQGPFQSADRYTVILLTMGPGDAVWEKFGHDALWVRDERDGTDRVYNWGVPPDSGLNWHTCCRAPSL